jgi:hypothetical protein
MTDKKKPNPRLYLKGKEGERSPSFVSKTKVDVGCIVNTRLGFLRDDRQNSEEELDSFLNAILNQTPKESKTRKNRCEICNSKEDLTDLELHHLAGRKHDWRTITACKKCHRKLSKLQGLWDARWLMHDLPEELRKAFFLTGLRDVLLLKAKYTENSLFSEYADSLIDEITALLRYKKQYDTAGKYLFYN